VVEDASGTAALSFPPALLGDLTDLDDVDALRSTPAYRHAHAYFVGSGDHPAYAGSHFERIGHPWWEDATANTFTPSDLLALGTLSTPLKKYTAARLLEPNVLERVTPLLREISLDSSIAEESASKALADDSPAAVLYNLVRNVGGMGKTRTSKLLARKRPGLVPIRDSNVEAAFGGSKLEAWWVPYRTMALAGEIPPIDLASRVHQLLDLSPIYTPLRVLDAILWRSIESPGGDGVDSEDEDE